MSEEKKVNVQTKESIALKLTIDIANQEDLHSKPDYRENILDLYAECLVSTSGRREFKKNS